MRMKTLSTLRAVSYCPPEITEISLPVEEILCESVNGMTLPDAGYDDTGLIF